MIRYPGSMAALDYTSHLTAFKSEDNSGEKVSISMNKILKKDGYRLYQSSYDEDENGTILSVSHDPYGITITYAGYFLLFVSLLAFFFVKETAFRKALSRLSLLLTVPENENVIIIISSAMLVKAPFLYLMFALRSVKILFMPHLLPAHGRKPRTNLCITALLISSIVLREFQLT